MPQCIPYARSRFEELTGADLPTSGSTAQAWWNNASEANKYTSIRAVSIAVWTRTDGSPGHVGVVESWDGSTMTYSDANYKLDEEIITRTGLSESGMKNLFGSRFTFKGSAENIV